MGFEPTIIDMTNQHFKPLNYISRAARKAPAAPKSSPPCKQGNGKGRENRGAKPPGFPRPPRQRRGGGVALSKPHQAPVEPGGLSGAQGFKFGPRTRALRGGGEKERAGRGPDPTEPRGGLPPRGERAPQGPALVGAGLTRLTWRQSLWTPLGGKGFEPMRSYKLPLIFKTNTFSHSAIHLGPADPFKGVGRV